MPIKKQNLIILHKLKFKEILWLVAIKKDCFQNLWGVCSLDREKTVMGSTFWEVMGTSQKDILNLCIKSSSYVIETKLLLKSHDRSQRAETEVNVRKQE